MRLCVSEMVAVLFCGLVAGSLQANSSLSLFLSVGYHTLAVYVHTACTLGASDAPMQPIVLRMSRDVPVVGCCSSSLPGSCEAVADGSTGRRVLTGMTAKRWLNQPGT